jgi:hypothetical protein
MQQEYLLFNKTFEFFFCFTQDHALSKNHKWFFCFIDQLSAASQYILYEQSVWGDSCGYDCISYILR